MAPRPAPHVALAVCALRDGALAVLQSAAPRPALPQAPLAADASPDDVADAFVRRLLGAAGARAWRAQAGALGGADGLAIVYVVVVPEEIAAPAGHAWQPVPRGGGTPAVRAAVATLRDRLDLEPVAFRLLPATFTLSDLQAVYELLLERRLHKASFRRSLLAAHLVEPTDAWRSEGRGRPAQLFRFAPRRRRGTKRPVRFELLG